MAVVGCGSARAAGTRRGQLGRSRCLRAVEAAGTRCDGRPFSHRDGEDVRWHPGGNDGASQAANHVLELLPAFTFFASTSLTTPTPTPSPRPGLVAAELHGHMLSSPSAARPRYGVPTSPPTSCYLKHCPQACADTPSHPFVLCASHCHRPSTIAGFLGLALRRHPRSCVVLRHRSATIDPPTLSRTST